MKHGDIRLAARQVQEIEMRKLMPQVEAANHLLEKNEKLRGEIAQLHTIGALPHFQGQPPPVPRPSGLPYDSSKSLATVEKIRKDVEDGRVLVISSAVDGPDAPIIATPTTTAQKNFRSERCPAISD